ncbi:DHA2 family efflux MFS transporter permease subunit [Vineibacter terrae]|uniref:DHA2 family efflux MFS transporter permease subunit n=1 Tax=Vineibacter terrae TaxID=2586908 RepID=UPI002E341E22|nr:DHA2 family efflux MFS transporter permease subunit [Vineibacter terrae]HEX2891057.1 DHA2 family efflux MFS transporter permease subunit [Vineibacter terrae]
MTSSTTIADPAEALSLGRRIMILIAVMLGSTLYATTLLIASTLLPQMQGAMSATQDEIAWVMTFNILATAVVTPMTGWMVARFGRRNVMVWSIFAFSVTTLLCGAAESLEMLVLWRILQGGLGAPVIPLSQTILLDSFPKRQAGMVTSIFGMAVVIGPVIGPTVGSLLAELHSWRWAFYMVVPVGLASFIGLRLTLPKDAPTGRTALDWTGFLSLSLSIACVQLMLSRGQRLDWFESEEVVIEALVAALAFYVFIAHSLTSQAPFLNLRLLLDRNYALGLVLVAIYGMLNFTPMVLLPPLLQQHAGFPDSIIGEVIAARGVGASIGFFLAIFIGKVDPRIGLIGGFGVQVLSGLWLMSLDLNVDVATLMANSMLQGIAVGVIWVPLTLATFATIDARYLAEGTAVYHLLRNIGSSFFISLCVAEIVRATGTNYGRMVEMVSPFNEALSLPWVMGGWTMDSTAGLARIAREINRQAAMIGYLNAFGLYTLASALAVPAILFVAGKARARNA